VVLLRNFKNIFLIPELTKKLLFTIGVLIVYRIGVFIPVIGVNIPLLAQYMSKASTVGGLLNYLDIFFGGALQQCTLFALGVGPYITASIMMQILSLGVPYFEQLAKEGDYGRKLINQYTRYLALGLSMFYAAGMAAFLESQNLAVQPGLAFRILFIISLAAGSMFCMWLGEQISLMGIGNGSSLILFTGIVTRFPDYVIKTVQWVGIGSLSITQALFVLLFFLAITACIVFLEKGDRKIPVQYARRVVGQRMFAGQSTYIPFKINTAGVMPVIYSGIFLQIPLFFLSYLAPRFEFFRSIQQGFTQTGLLFNGLQFGLIVFFTYFFATLFFNPVELADQMKKNGGFVPGIRPGKQTADYFDYVLTRISLVGAIYLGLLASLPNFLNAFISLPFYLGGTSLLIAVGVALDTASQIESYLIEHRYEGFLTTGMVKARELR
jgi:preprotein translocase subunit SecY